MAWRFDGRERGSCREKARGESEQRWFEIERTRLLSMAC